ncbi:MAG: hypothetical protein Roseis2KO_11940 [Roseivirga sp.]
MNVQLKAQRLSYDLNKGEEFYYKVTRKLLNGLKDHEEQWLTFNVREVNSTGYDMSLKFMRIREQDSTTAFDTNAYYQPGIETPFKTILLKQITIDQPIYFKLSRKGEISDIKLSENLETAVEKNITNIIYRMNAVRASFISKGNLRTLLRTVFPPLPEKSSQSKWQHTRMSHSKWPEIETTYLLNDNKTGRYHLTFSQKTSLPDSLTHDLYFQNKAITIYKEIEGDYEMSTINTLTEAFAATATASIIRWRDKGGRTVLAPEDVKADINVEKLQTQFNDQKTTISGKTLLSENGLRLELGLGNDEPDNELIDVQLSPETGKEFIQRIDLKRPVEVHLLRSSNVVSNYFHNLLIEPGDSLYLFINKEGELTVTGKGIEKTDILRRVRATGDNDYKDRNQSEMIRMAEQNLSSKLAMLEESKTPLSEWAYNHIKSDIFYREQSRLLDYYEKHKYNKPDLFRELFTGLNLNQFTSSTSSEFRTFASKYIKANSDLLRSGRYLISPGPEEYYWLSKMLFAGELRYYGMAKEVTRALNAESPAAYEGIYTDFQETFPNSELAQSLSTIHATKTAMKVGAIVPDFSFRTFDKKEVKVSSFKGKWVLLSFIDLNDPSDRVGLYSLRGFQKELPAEGFELVVVFTNRKVDINKDLDLFQVAGTFLYSDDDISNNSPFNLEQIENHYLIDPNGEIQHRVADNSRGDILKIMAEYVSYKLENKKADTSNDNMEVLIWFIVPSLIVIATIWLYFVLKTKRIKNREKAKLEKVEMEIKAVRSQLNPHFLFNAMSSIQHLVNINDNEKANLFLSRFAGLMRKVLNQTDLQLQSLAQELDTLNDYLSLEALRHGFQFSIQVDDLVDIHSIDIPPMLLQPFVENAVVHGISQSSNPGEINISITNKSPESISITILDNGVGLYATVEGKTGSNGKGLELTRRRIALIMQKFKNEISFILKDRKEHDGQPGALAEIIVQLEN